jgi:hypothetical protein
MDETQLVEAIQLRTFTDLSSLESFIMAMPLTQPLFEKHFKELTTRDRMDVIRDMPEVKKVALKCSTLSD